MSHPSRHGSEAPTGLTFGSAAEGYEKYRLEYPVEIAEAVMAYASGAVRTALEIGAGTGKATRLFAGRGLEVTAVEPDAGMAALLRASTRELSVQTVVATFEAFQPHRRFDLLFSAAAWHWTDPDTRWANAARTLRSSGTLALFGVPGDVADARLAEAVENVERAFLRPGFTHPGAGWSTDQIERSGWFADVEESRLARSSVSSAEDYVGRLATTSSYLELETPTRIEALQAVRAVLPDHVAVDATVQLVVGRRRAGRRQVRSRNANSASRHAPGRSR